MSPTSQQVRFPLHRKFLFSLLLVLTAVASLITFIMAGFFHDDKEAYIKDWISIAAVNTAGDCETLLGDYRQRMELYARVVLEDLPEATRTELKQQFFDGLPTLVGISIRSKEETIEQTLDANAIADSGVSQEEFEALMSRLPVPTDRVLTGEVHVGNSTVLESLPTFMLAVPFSSKHRPDPLIISAIFRSEALLRLGSQFPVFDVVIAAADGTLLVHPDARRLLERKEAGIEPAAAAVHRQDHAAVTLEFESGGREMLAGYAAVPTGQLTVAVQIPKSTAYLASRNLLSRLLVVAFGLLLLAALFGVVWAHRITRPVVRLSRATRRVARGDFDVQVDVTSRDEIGALAGSFNQMATELKVREEALSTAQAQLLQSEKMAAFGQLGAGIAHEVKNPLAGILGCAQLTLMDLDDRKSVEENLQLIEKEAGRCREIINNLMKFARQEKAALEPIEVNPVIDDAAAIVNHQLELNRIRLIRDLGTDVSMIFGNANQLEQVLINLFINALQAMEEQSGTITVTTRMADADHVEIRVSDTGPGVPKEIQSKLFEPFFSTKPTGKGTGLGLSVSFGIIRDHDGVISIESAPGEGATFVIRIPALSLKRDGAPLPRGAALLAVRAGPVAAPDTLSSGR